MIKNFYQQFRDFVRPSKKVRVFVFGKRYNEVLKEWKEPSVFFNVLNRAPQILREMPEAMVVSVSTEDGKVVSEWYRDSVGKLHLA